MTLQYQTLTALAGAFHHLGLLEPVADIEALAKQVLEDFQRLLIVDGILTGLAHFRGDGRVDYLLHPRDAATGLSYSLLAMVHAIINGLFTPEQAGKHLGVIEQHLLGPDGARLFNWPMEYNGGPQKYFQRAESSTFFGREIGLMYTHAHLRYAEACWHYGDVESFFRALCLANPIGIRSLVPPATLRQANCYYSSSDAAFADRYDAYDRYDQAMRGMVPLDGGWRIYSSGAGIGIRLILCCFLGLRQEKSALVLDPAIPPRSGWITRRAGDGWPFLRGHLSRWERWLRSHQGEAEWCRALFHARRKSLPHRCRRSPNGNGPQQAYGWHEPVVDRARLAFQAKRLQHWRPMDEPRTGPL